MAIKCSAPDQALKKFYSLALKIFREELLEAFKERGERSIALARDRSEAESWTDRTGNLRSSIGYAIYAQGVRQLESAFNVVKDGSEGSTEGQNLIQELANEYTNTYALVVVAGMNYASFVEAGGFNNRKPHDVLASAKLKALQMAESDINKATAKAIVRINKIQL